ncbi:MAG: hypothetical protein WBC85_00350 [Planktotalea sp.]|uniref:hypothetical protein n=1 Tax=Planktotalea sp. TaxID=2029877 RepID=UPI003C70F84E
MHRTFISTVVAAALAITGVSSTMAQAGEYRYAPQPQHRSSGGNEVAAAALAGIATLFIIGKTLERHQGHREKVIVRPSAPRHSHNQGRAVPSYQQKHRAGSNRHNGRTLNHWHTHSNGKRHKHPHKANHHYGDR